MYLQRMHRYVSNYTTEFRDFDQEVLRSLPEARKVL